MISVIIENKYCIIAKVILLAIGVSALLFYGYIGLGILGLAITGPMAFEAKMIIQKHKRKTIAYIIEKLIEEVIFNLVEGETVSEAKQKQRQKLRRKFPTKNI